MELDEQPVKPRSMMVYYELRGIVNCPICRQCSGLNTKVHVSDDTALPEENGGSLGLMCSAINP